MSGGVLPGVPTGSGGVASDCLRLLAGEADQPRGEPALLLIQSLLLAFWPPLAISLPAHVLRPKGNATEGLEDVCRDGGKASLLGSSLTPW